jgi:hypothetical protein
MSGAKINNYSTIDNNIEELELTVDKCFNDRLTLTEMTTTTVPAIAAGSRIEVGGAFFKFDSDEAISTTDPATTATVADGIVYVMLKPSVDGLTISAVFTATAPTWSDAKQGWYGTSTYAGYKYINYILTKATAVYYKYILNNDNNRFPPRVISGLLNGITNSTAYHTFTMEYDFLVEKNGTDEIKIKKSGLFLISVTAQGATAGGSASGSESFVETLFISGGVICSASSTISTGNSLDPCVSFNKVLFLKIDDIIKIQGKASGQVSSNISGFFSIIAL